MRMRIVATTKSGNIHYGKSAELDATELKEIKDFGEQIGALNYLKIGTESGNTVYIRGDALESFMLELMEI